jgi:hypothetical protein
VDEVHQPQVAPEFLEPLDPFVVVDEIPAAVKDEPVAVNLDPFGMVRRVPVNDIDPGIVDEPTGELLMRPGNLPAPVAPPSEWTARPGRRVA